MLRALILVLLAESAAAFKPMFPARRRPLTVAPSVGGAAPTTYDGVRIGPPPDLPSLLLHNRIVYIGMPLVPAVTELIIAELLYLNYESGDKVH